MIPIKKYNPAFLTDQELIDIFCVRLHEFDSIIETIKENDASSNQNVLVIGPRGSGKSTLLLRVAVELKKNKKLAKDWYPIIFAEESYEISSIGEFWLECLFHLGDQYFSETGDKSLQTAHQELHSELNDDHLKTKCLALIRDFADDHNKRIVLVVENLNMLFDSQLTNASDTGWSLRHTLQKDSRIMLLASSTSRFDAVENPKEALYDLFRRIKLKPLNTEECATLWEKSSGKKPKKETIEAIRILTGGSSRLVSIIARFGAERSFNDLMKNLLDLVDDNTEYFKSHLELLPPSERRVYLSLADLWKPATAKEVAIRSRQTSSKVSAQLKRLIQRGVVIEVAGEPRKKKYYLAERMYNIYYLLRRKRNADSMVQALISFMTAYFSEKELPELAQDFVDDISKNGKAPPKIFFQALEKLCDTLKEKDNQSLMLALPDSFLQWEQVPNTFKEKAIVTKLSKFLKTEEYEEGLILINRTIEILDNKINDDALLKVKLIAIRDALLSIMKKEKEYIKILLSIISEFNEKKFPMVLRLLINSVGLLLRKKHLLKILLDINDERLLPLVVALKMELEPDEQVDVAIEVEEVAKNIRKEMEELSLKGLGLISEELSGIMCELKKVNE